MAKTPQGVLLLCVSVTRKRHSEEAQVHEFEKELPHSPHPCYMRAGSALDPTQRGPGMIERHESRTPRAIILAAGTGSRLVAQEAFPKPLKTVSGVPLIVRVL